MTHQTLEQELLVLEKRYWQAQKDKQDAITGTPSAEIERPRPRRAGVEGEAGLG
jgi:hypothetical protein